MHQEFYDAEHNDDEEDHFDDGHGVSDNTYLAMAKRLVFRLYASDIMELSHYK